MHTPADVLPSAAPFPLPAGEPPAPGSATPAPPLAAAADLPSAGTAPVCSAPQRVIGYDIARGLAVVLMIVVNVTTILPAEDQGAGGLMAVLDFIFGRSAALFILLAGIGVSLMAGRAKGLPKSALQGHLFRRSGVLLAAGYLLQQWWTADILHFYGLFLAASALMLSVSSRGLKLAAAAVWLGGFAAYYTTATAAVEAAHPAAGWVMERLGQVAADLLFDGCYSLFPWFALILLGMGVGRLPAGWPLRRGCLGLLVALCVTAAGLDHLGGRLLDGAAQDSIWPLFLLTSEVFPPSPVFMLSAASTAVLAIALSFHLSNRWPAHLGVRLLQSVGRLSLTVYIGHLLAAKVVAAGMAGTGTPLSAAGGLALALAMVLAAVLSAHAWCRRFPHGPLEWWLRRLSAARLPAG
jgi:uncharacterized protein